MKNIVQIIPCDDWEAVFVDEKGDLEAWTLIAWALVKSSENNLETVEGMVAGYDGIVDIASTASNFLGYKHRVEPLSNLKDYLPTHLKKRR